jgi:hypothetical protein
MRKFLKLRSTRCILMKGAFRFLLIAALMIAPSLDVAAGWLLLVKSGGGGYTGPLDVTGYTSAYAYWGMRCGSTSYTGNVADVFDSATGTIETLITCSSGGILNQTINSLATTCASSCIVKRLYDQTGHSARDLVPVTTGPPLILSGVGFGTNPVMQFTSGSFVMVSSSVPSAQAQPLTVSIVAQNIASATNGIMSDGTFNTMMLWALSSGTVRVSTPTDTNFTGVTDTQWASYSSLLNGSGSTVLAANASSSPSCNTFNTGNPGTNGIAGTNKLTMGAMTDAAGVPMNGYIFEAVVVAGAVSQANQTTECLNQRAYGGF